MKIKTLIFEQDGNGRYEKPVNTITTSNRNTEKCLSIHMKKLQEQFS